MKDIKKNITTILLSVACTLLLVIVILLIVDKNTYKFSNSSNRNDTDTKNVKEVEKKKEVEKDVEKEVLETKEEKVEEKKIVEEAKQEVKTVVEEEKSEENLLTYFNTQSDLFNSGNSDESFTSKLKTSFTSIIDFIFYDKEIKGYKFKDLTNSAKLKVISIALTIDNKIDTYFPNYKEKIKDKYVEIKASLAAKYLEVTASFCSKDPETCSQAEEDFENMKNAFGLTGKKVSEVIKNAGSKIKELYENWR